MKSTINLSGIFILIVMIMLLASCNKSGAAEVYPGTGTSSVSDEFSAAVSSQPAVPTPTPTATAEPTPQKQRLFPQVDSSTARKDMVASLYNDFVAQGSMTGPEPLCSKTHQAICNLVDGKADIVFALLPTEEEQKYMAEKNVDLKVRCYAFDALLILGNADNPVKNLSSDQLRDIYRKKITNWKEVGGPDAAISVYVRNSQSGSQRMFESLVWEGQTDVPNFTDGSFSDMEEILAMDELVNQVEWDVNGIGYSFMTFVDGEFGTSERLKSFAIDGIHPDNTTIANESYPLITTAWVLMRADDASDSPAAWLFDWFVEENAQKYIVEHTSSIPANKEPMIVKAER